MHPDRRGPGAGGADVVVIQLPLVAVDHHGPPLGADPGVADLTPCPFPPRAKGVTQTCPAGEAVWTRAWETVRHCWDQVGACQSGKRQHSGGVATRPSTRAKTWRPCVSRLVVA